MFTFQKITLDENSIEATYVDLVLNPERYTGYSGHSPHRIWSAIYNENCFKYNKRNVHFNLFVHCRSKLSELQLEAPSMKGTYSSSFFFAAHVSSKNYRIMFGEKGVFQINIRAALQY